MAACAASMSFHVRMFIIACCAGTVRIRHRPPPWWLLNLDACCRGQSLCSGESRVTMLKIGTLTMFQQLTQQHAPLPACPCRFLDEYDLKVSSGAFKYKKAAEFLMNNVILGIKGIVTDIVTAKEAAAARATAAEASVTQVRAGACCSRLSSTAPTQRSILWCC